MRWIHVTSVVTLIGSFIYARYIAAPALASLDGPARAAFEKNVIERFRPLAYTLLATILGSGLYNYLTKPGYPPHYHMWIGIKFLFVLHIFAVTILYTKPVAEESKRNRWLTGMVWSGLVIFAISAFLRWMTMQATV
jgi:hypothetical protein